MWRSVNSTLVGSRGGQHRKSFLPGTVLTGFQQTAAPLGWVRLLTNDDSIVRINGSTAPGTGGTNGFTATFNTQTQTGSQSISTATTASGSTGTGTSGATTITTTTLASHSHSFVVQINTTSGNGLDAAASGSTSTDTGNILSNGSDGSHTHSIPALSIPSLGVNSFTAGPLSITTNIKYTDILVAKKT